MNSGSKASDTWYPTGELHEQALFWHANQADLDSQSLNANHAALAESGWSVEGAGTLI